MKVFLAVLISAFIALFLTVTVWFIPQYFLNKTIIKPSPDNRYEAHVELKRIPGGTVTDVFSVPATVTVKIYDTAEKKFIGSAVTISGENCVYEYKKNSELIQWKSDDSLLVWCADVHVVGKLGSDAEFTTVEVTKDSILQIDVFSNSLNVFFVDPQSIFE